MQTSSRELQNKINIIELHGEGHQQSKPNSTETFHKRSSQLVLKQK